ncbi:hypothetical protein DFAR_3100007 [Desulfarculales bacterium]
MQVSARRFLSGQEHHSLTTLAGGDSTLARAGDSGPRLLFVEPYANASHRALLEGLLGHVPARWTALTLPRRHFRWRLRGAASFLACEVTAFCAPPC